jgi:hypothetical protein
MNNFFGGPQDLSIWKYSKLYKSLPKGIDDVSPSATFFYVEMLVSPILQCL